MKAQAVAPTTSVGEESGTYTYLRKDENEIVFRLVSFGDEGKPSIIYVRHILKKKQ